MISHAVSYHRHRFPAEIISHAVWLYHGFCLSFRDTEDLLAQRGITVSYEAIRQWCRRFGPAYARILRRRQGRLGDTWHLDELFVNIQGCQQGVVKLTKNRLTSPQELAVWSRCGRDELCRSSEIAPQLDNAARRDDAHLSRRCAAPLWGDAAAHLGAASPGGLIGGA